MELLIFGGAKAASFFWVMKVVHLQFGDREMKSCKGVNLNYIAYRDKFGNPNDSSR